MKINTNKVILKLTAGLTKQFPHDGKPQIAFSGRSNVGKSSLLNTLAGRKSLARVSSSPGKTVTINFYEVDGAIYLVDLPGYGYAKRSADSQAVWSTLTEQYFTGEGSPVAVIQLVDLKVGPTADDLMMLEFLSQNEMPFFVVATKADKLNKTDRTKQLEKLGSMPILKDVPIIPFSALKGEGKEAVWSEIFKHLQ